jgi:MFS family permease
VAQPVSRRVSDVFLNVGHAFDHLFMLIFPTVVLAMAPEFGKSYSELLPLSLGGFVMFGVGSLPAGWLADRWSRHGMMVVFFVGMGAASILTGFARTTWEVAAAITLMGVFGAIYHPVGIAMLVSGRDKVGRVLGVNGVFGNLGLASAALVAGAFAHWWSWRAAFIAPGVVAVLVGIAFALLVPEGRYQPPTSGRRSGGALPRGMLVRVLAVVTVATICGGVIFNSTTVAMPKVFDERLQSLVSTTLGVGVLVFFVYAIAAMAQLVVGHLIDRYPIRVVFVGVAAMQVPLLFIAAASQQAAMLAVALAMMFFVFGQVPINDAMVAAYTDERWRARALSVRYVVSFGANAASVPLIAWTYGATGGFAELFVILGTLAALMLAMAMLYPAQTPRAIPVQA